MVLFLIFMSIVSVIEYKMYLKFCEFVILYFKLKKCFFNINILIKRNGMEFKIGL